VKTKQAEARSLTAKANALDRQRSKYDYKNKPYNPKNFFGSNSGTRAANMAKASPEKLAEYKSLKQVSDKFSRDRNKFGKLGVEASNKAFYARKAAAAARPGTMLRSKPKAAAPAPAPKAKPANKIAPSPRRANVAEAAYREIRSQKSKFGSDKKVMAEMERRGFLNAKDKRGQMIRIASNSRRKQGIGRKHTSYFP
jgi:hypothetical protein